MLDSMTSQASCIGRGQVGSCAGSRWTPPREPPPPRVTGPHPRQLTVTP